LKPLREPYLRQIPVVFRERLHGIEKHLLHQILLIVVVEVEPRDRDRDR
jgi:hypothetical protein